MHSRALQAGCLFWLRGKSRTEEVHFAFSWEKRSLRDTHGARLEGRGKGKMPGRGVEREKRRTVWELWKPLSWCFWFLIGTWSMQVPGVQERKKEDNGGGASKGRRDRSGGLAESQNRLHFS